MSKKKIELVKASVAGLPETAFNALFSDVSRIIESRKCAIAQQANSGFALMYWEVGKRINKEILNNARASYGKKIVMALSSQLESKYGVSFKTDNLRRMMQFARQFEDIQIVASVTRQLSWGHIREILPLETMEAKLYYVGEAAKGMLGVKALRNLISRKGY